MQNISSTQLHGLSVSVSRPRGGTGETPVGPPVELRVRNDRANPPGGLFPPSPPPATNRQHMRRRSHTQMPADALNSAWRAVFIRTASLTAAGRVRQGSYLRLSCALPFWRLIRKDTGRTQSRPASPIRPPPLLPKCHLSSPPSYVALHYYSTPICLILMQ